jgi:hypothetical protein
MTMAMQPQMTGVESLQSFQNNMNSTSGLERLRALQTLGLMSLATDTYMTDQSDQPMMNQGLSGLPVVQAGFGGFLGKVFKAVTKPFKAVAKGIGKIARSPIGKIALPIAGAFLMPMAFGVTMAGNLGAYSALAGIGSGLGSLVAGAKPGDALKAAALAGLGTYAGGSLFGKFGTGAGTGGTSGTGAALTNTGKLVSTGAARSVGGGTASLGSLGTGAGQASQSFGAFGTGPAAVRAANVASAVPTATVTGGNPLLASMNQQNAVRQALTKVGLPSIDQSVQPMFSGIQYGASGSASAPFASVQPGAADILKGDFSLDALKNLPRQTFDRLTKTPEGWGAIGRDLMPGAFDQPQEISKKDLEDYGFKQTPSSFGTQEAYYVNPDTGQEMSTAQAIQYMRSKGTGGNKYTQATTTGFGNLAPNIRYRAVKDGGAILRNSGGLMGYAYGGQLPEFSGQVPGEGHGMEDNISFPIIEEKSNIQLAEGRLSPDEYVVDANTMSLLGNGSPDAGAKIMDETVKDIRMAATGQDKQQKEINGLKALARMRRVT